MGRILHKRGGKRSFYTVCSQSCVVLGGKLATVGKRYSKDISRGDKGRTFFSAGWTVWDELTVSPWITTL